MKHGVSSLEAESCFYDSSHQIFEDLRHSSAREKRYILYGKGLENRVLMIGFTLRAGKVRVITARPASRKERAVYEGEKERD
ncbi:BrnT family toxin [Deltaproteobacteria bacterium PRO3]|nr:BrnT family toxin [Deltaproteobacteria bacterium PRO3]